MKVWLNIILFTEHITCYVEIEAYDMYDELR